MKTQIPPFTHIAVNRACGNDFNASSISAFASLPEFQDLTEADVDYPAESLNANYRKSIGHLLSNSK